MCIRDRVLAHAGEVVDELQRIREAAEERRLVTSAADGSSAVSYTHLRAHETVLDLVCRLLLEKKKRPSFVTRCMHNTPIVCRVHAW